MRQLLIAQAGSRTALEWPIATYTWDSLATKLETPVRGSETVSEYFAMTKAKRGKLKDVGGFVGGTFKDNRRKALNVRGRDILTLDLDSLAPDTLIKALKNISGQNARYIVYSTRSHTPATPRIRVLMEIDRTVSAEEYEPIARKTAEAIGILEYCDPTTFEPSRLMYWPSVSKDGQYLYYTGGTAAISADGVLGLYTDWHDIKTWPRIAPLDTKPHKAGAKQADPTSKEGVVGAFCRTYGVAEAISTYLADVYEPCEGGRYTYIQGSTVGGAVVYDDKFLYSHHATDPTSGQLCNAFDLVRLHLFGAKDDELKDDAPSTKLPSYIAMVELALADDKVSALLSQERQEARKQQLDGMYIDQETAEDSGEWRKYLRYHKQTGEALSTIGNVCLIILKDPLLKDKIRFNEFSQRLIVTGRLPWNLKSEPRYWSDTDDAGLRQYLEGTYLISGKEKVNDGLINASQRRKFNPIKEYIESVPWDGKPRIESCLRDFLGCEDNVYTREASRKFFCAGVARVYKPAVKFDSMIIISGAQGAGKSTFVRKLGGEWFSDSLQTFLGKEASEMIQGVWINEIPELHSFAKMEVNAIKQFLSKQEDIYREAYGRRTEKRPRTCLFVGTTNDYEYLRDTTGNRRFWPIDMEPEKAKLSIFEDLTPEYVQQLWAEAMVVWQGGETLYLSKWAEIKAEEIRKQHEESNAKQGLIEDYLDMPLPVNWDKMPIPSRRLYLSGDSDYTGETKPRDRVCVAEVWVECLGQELKYIQRKDQMEINNILLRLEGWHRHTSSTRLPIYGVQRCFIKNT